MENARWEQIKSLFARVKELPPPARAEFLSQQCDGDDALLREVESLLREHKADLFRTGGAADAIANASTASLMQSTMNEIIGTVIGPYKILQSIGEGGFGTVFLAEQTSPVRRRVALKIIKAGMDTKQVVARFEAERQALAIMDHPHIARVLDGGATPETAAGGGRPYFVMEYVVGDAITRFADAHSLTLRERLDLFQQVCSAVQHAHTKGVIHRDLKPGNVLVSMVDGKPFAKVIDFGIAKATAQPLTAKTLFTEHRQLVGTPEYMSPEQAEGSQDIDTRTDVYSLGVLLYELLTGNTPIEGKRLRSAAYDEMRRMIREEEPLAPSMKISRSLETLATAAAARKVEPSRLSALVKGELDWIVLKALDKDRARRYETPNAFADDVRRHLSGEPVTAAPVSAAYRVRKFVRRNRAAVGTVSAVMLALAAGGSVAAWQWSRAERQALSAKKVVADIAGSFARHDMALAESQGLALPEGEPFLFVGTPGGRLAVSRNGTEPTMELYKEDPSGRKTVVDDVEGLTAVAMLANRALESSLDSQRMLTRERDAAEWSAYTANLALAQAALDADDYPEARRVLARTPESKRGWEWNFMNGQTVGAVKLAGVSGAETIQFAEFTPHGHRIATSQSGGATRLWDTHSGKPIATLSGHKSDVTYARFNLDGDRLLTVASGPDASAMIWDTSDGTLVAELRRGNDITKYRSTGVHIADFSPDGARVAISAGKGEALLWNATTGEQIATLAGEPLGDICEITFGPGGARLVTRSHGGTARLWDGITGNLIATTPTSSFSWWDPVFNSDGSRVLTRSRPFGAYVTAYQLCDGVTGESVATLPGHKTTVAAAAFSPDGKRIMTADYEGGVRLWDAISGELVAQSHIPTVMPESMTFSADGALCVGHSKYTPGVFVLDGRTGSRLGLLSSARWTSTPSISPDGTLIAAASMDGPVLIWDSRSGKKTGTVHWLTPILEEGVSHRVAFDPTGTKLLASTSQEVWLIDRDRTDNDTRVLRTDTLRELRLAVIDIAEPMLRSDALTTPDGTRRIVGGSDKTVRFYEAKDGKPTLPATTEQPEGVYREVAVFRMDDAVTNLQMTGDGSRLTIHLADGSARVWDIREPEERRKDLQAEWAERVPAGAYLDTLWNATNADGSLAIPDDKLRDTIVNDASLAPLRQLVAAEMLEERLEYDRLAAAQVFAAITKDQTDKIAVQAAAESTELPKRVKARVMTAALSWEPPKP